MVRGSDFSMQNLVLNFPELSWVGYVSLSDVYNCTSIESNISGLNSLMSAEAEIIFLDCFISFQRKPWQIASISPKQTF